MNPEIIAQFDRRVPRYTSYPTAADFSPAVDAAAYRDWLGAVPAGEPVSLYLHVPFCHRLCWFCGCHTTVARRYDPVAAYLELLEREIDIVADALSGRRRVLHMHWGGGTPTILAPDDVRRLVDRLAARFELGGEFAVEIDPRAVDRDTIDALAAGGLTRASLGVQDFDPRVQRAVNRVQPFGPTRRVVDGLRDAGVAALNIDLLYGLPHQTEAGLVETVDRAITLRPDRVALYGYAHVPWMKRHQGLIDEAALPGAAARARLFAAASARFVAHGYVAIGLDHFALPGDALAVAARDGRLRRNFQGYTVEPAETLIGLGASAIGTLAQGYVQNAAKTPDYRAAIMAGRLATARGVALDGDDRPRRAVIERLMCDLEVDLDALCAEYGVPPTEFADALGALAPLAAIGAVEIAGGRVRVAADARLLLRVVCAAFDRRLAPRPDRHARAV